MNLLTMGALKIVCRLVLIIAAGLVLLSGSRMWSSVKASTSEDFNIHLASTTFDPLDYVPPAPFGMGLSAQQAAQAGLYLVQFNGPVLEEWKQQLVSAGAQLGPYIPQYAFVVKLDQPALALVQGLPFVRWVGPFQPGYKLSPDIERTLKRSYTVTLAPWSDVPQMNSLAHSLDAKAQVYSQNMLIVLDPAQLDLMASHPNVLWIEPYYLRTTNNNVAGGTIMNGSTAWANGYTGAGVTVAVADTGLDTGNAASLHMDFMNSGATRVAHISSWPVLPYSDGYCTVANAGANDGAADLDSGHGTHVTGSVAGNGARSGGTYKGLAYESSITFQAVEQYVTFNSNCSGDNGYYLLGIPDDVRLLLTEVYNWGARVQNDSWGGGSPGVYDQQASYFDDFIYNHPDFAVVVAAGNAGRDTNLDGYVDDGSIDSPGTAKNVITIGATESERIGSSCNPGGISGYSGCTYGYLWGGLNPNPFPLPPTSSDVISNNRGQMAAFSSRGPAADGRIRPDVVAPGTDIISTRSSLAVESGWGALNPYYESMGGTSMASPLTAGSAALVREFLIKHEAIANPSAALIKATLINTAVDIPGYGNPGIEAGAPIPNNSEGWGRVDVGAATADGRTFMDGASLTTGAAFDRMYAITAGAPFKVTLAWSDYPAAASASVTLVNDLNLKLTAPDGSSTYWGNVFSGGWSATGGSPDNRNNVENAYIQNPAEGLWRVQIIGLNIPHGPQPYALVMSGNVSSVIPEDFSKTSPANHFIGTSTDPLLAWETSSRAVSYEYCIDTISNSVCDTAWISTGADTSVSLTGLEDGTYYWQVRADNTYGSTEANKGTWWSFYAGQIHTISLPLVVKYYPPSPPLAFNKSSPANGATNQPAGPTLSWAAGIGADSYSYCLDKDTNSTCSSGWHNVDANTSAAVGSLDPSSTYSWQVRATNPLGSTDANGGTWWTFRTAAPPPPYTTIATQNFEGSFPGVWKLYHSGGYDWGKRNCKPFAGSYSGWAVGGGSSGSSLGCGSNYPLSSNSWMVYGPFSLANATAADLSFQYWLNSEVGYDELCAFASLDDNYYYGNCSWGNSGGWTSKVFDLSNVYTLGNLTGKSSVWIALVFESDSLYNYPEGAYVDNIVLRKCTSAVCAAGINSNGGRLMEVPSTGILPKP